MLLGSVAMPMPMLPNDHNAYCSHAMGDYMKGGRSVNFLVLYNIGTDPRNEIHHCTISASPFYFRGSIQRLRYVCNRYQADIESTPRIEVFA